MRAAHGAIASRPPACRCAQSRVASSLLLNRVSPDYKPRGTRSTAARLVAPRAWGSRVSAAGLPACCLLNAWLQSPDFKNAGLDLALIALFPRGNGTRRKPGDPSVPEHGSETGRKSVKVSTPAPYCRRADAQLGLLLAACGLQSSRRPQLQRPGKTRVSATSS